jgi:predicted transcriptional regulator
MNYLLSDLSERDFEIFNIIMKKWPLTKKDLIDQTHFKLTTLNRSMMLLEKKNS